ncbi:MAG: cellulase family glycosylhydrolase [Polyangiaceae bacterium]
MPGASHLDAFGLAFGWHARCPTAGVHRLSPSIAFAVGTVFFFCGCSAASSGNGDDSGGGSSSGGASSGGAGDSGSASSSDASSDATGSGDDAGSPASEGGSPDAKAPAGDGGLPSGWLYTSGSKIDESNGSGGGSVWVGRGVNVDDIFMCGYDNSLWMTNADQTLETEMTTLFSGWKATFLRISLAMNSYGTAVSWLSNPSQYATPMTNVIRALGAHPGVHVLVTLRSDVSMIGQDTADGDPEATGLPSDGTTTPDAAKYPTGTDAVYRALVDAFANDGFVLFGLTNEPGGNKLSSAKIAAAMSHAVGTIRAEEDKLGVPHHVVSVQGNNWTSDISFYATTPLPYDDVVYEVHGYPPTTASYTYSNIPVILGEYGSLASGASSTFYADLEAKQISNLAWDFDPYSNCAPDLVNVNQSPTNITPTAWGMTVQSYLAMH